MSVAGNIRRLRTQNNMTQEELAEKMFVSRQTVSSWETDRNRPDVDTLTSLAAVFETDVNELIYGSPKSAYQKYQKRFIAAIAISVLFLIIMGVIRGIILPNWIKARGRKMITSPANLVFPLISEAIIFFLAGVLNLSVFSLWFDCRLRKTKIALIVEIIMTAPSLLLLLTYTIWLVFPNSPLTWYFVLIGLHYKLLRIPLFWMLPFISGCVFFFRWNRKSN